MTIEGFIKEVDFIEETFINDIIFMWYIHNPYIIYIYMINVWK